MISGAIPGPGIILELLLDLAPYLFLILIGFYAERIFKTRLYGRVVDIVILFLAGLAIVQVHNRWTVSWPVMATLSGWFAILVARPDVRTSRAAGRPGCAPDRAHRGCVLAGTYFDVPRFSSPKKRRSSSLYICGTSAPFFAPGLSRNSGAIGSGSAGMVLPERAFDCVVEQSALDEMRILHRLLAAAPQSSCSNRRRRRSAAIRRTSAPRSAWPPRRASLADRGSR